MVLTAAGIFTYSRSPHPLNASAPIAATLPAMVICSRLLHPSKALIPIEVTPSEMTALVISSSPLNIGESDISPVPSTVRTPSFISYVRFSPHLPRFNIVSVSIYLNFLPYLKAYFSAVEPSAQTMTSYGFMVSLLSSIMRSLLVITTSVSALIPLDL